MTGLENTTLYNEDMKGIAISSASFELFIREDALYVDKTSYIYKIVKNPARNFHFVSRPRRFGKSLFCNTLESLFKGNKELFKGLSISTTSMISSLILCFISISVACRC